MMSLCRSRIVPRDEISYNGKGARTNDLRVALRVCGDPDGRDHVVGSVWPREGWVLPTAGGCLMGRSGKGDVTMRSRSCTRLILRDPEVWPVGMR